MYNIKTRTINSTPPEIEFDYSHPISKKRVRRKLVISPANAEMVCTLLDIAIEENLTMNELMQRISFDPLYSASKKTLLESCKILYYDYNDEHEYVDDELLLDKLLDSTFNSFSDINICFLGRAGVGKSSIIRKMSYFADTDLNFPFTDTSRTTSYSAKYYFTSHKDYYRFSVAFMPESIINNRIDECIERGVYQAIKLRCSGTLIKQDKDESDSIISSFYDDPSKLFDIRLILGKHIKKTSKKYNVEENQTYVTMWLTIAKFCSCIANLILSQEGSNTDDANFYQEKFTKLVKSSGESEVKKTYEKFRNYIMSVFSMRKGYVYSEIEKNICLTKRSFDSTIFSCEYCLNDMEQFTKFISIFTSKNYEYYGNSLLPLVYELRIELPYNKHISDVVMGKKICCLDTVGIAHTNDSNGGFEKSTQLKFENIDAIIIADDSKISMGNDTRVILKHIISRVDFKKIYFAMTFFDELTKEEFDPDDDLVTQKIEYLESIQKQKIIDYLENSKISQPFSERVSKKATFYLSGLKTTSSEGFDELNRMLDSIRKSVDISKSKKNVCKDKPDKPIVIYDNKKLSLIYIKMRADFIASQENEYLVRPPHFKTTEALTRRLANNETCFYGKRILKPVDDLYNIIVFYLKEYILNPSEINVVGETDEDVKSFLEELNTLITDRLASYVKQLFFTKEIKARWEWLWLDGGTGVDYRRRNGIIHTELEIMPKAEAYLQIDNATHVIETLDTLITQSVQDFELKI